MTPDQFKAWFEGFCEGISEAPTPEQWAKIKAKVEELRSIALAPSRPPEWNRQWVQNGMPYNPVVGTSGEPLPERGRIVVTTHRVRDLVTGADLGPSD